MLPDPCLPPQPPVWTAASDAPSALPQACPGFLIHQARFHVGDTLWLTPLLRAIHRFFPGARTTVVGPPVARELFAGNPHVEEIVPYVPSPGREREERRRVLETLRARAGGLAGRRFDAALFAFARRRESRWLARAVAAAGVPCRINLEYVDPALDPAIPAWLTHEGWFVWGTLPSPRMLLHALDPLLGRKRAVWTEDDRRVELYVSAEARRRAGELLTERGLKDPFAILAPGGRSSLRWPARSFARLAARLVAEAGLHILIEGSPGERELLEAVASQAGGERVLAAADPLDVFAALLERARLLVANDSAPIHLAEATGTLTVYFAQREKLIHSHPAAHLKENRCRALYAAANGPSRITVGQALAAIRELTTTPSAGRR